MKSQQEKQDPENVKKRKKEGLTTRNVNIIIRLPDQRRTTIIILPPWRFLGIYFEVFITCISHAGTTDDVVPG